MLPTVGEALKCLIGRGNLEGCHFFTVYVSCVTSPMRMHTPHLVSYNTPHCPPMLRESEEDVFLVPVQKKKTKTKTKKMTNQQRRHRQKIVAPLDMLDLPDTPADNTAVYSLHERDIPFSPRSLRSETVVAEEEDIRDPDLETTATETSECDPPLREELPLPVSAAAAATSTVDSIVTHEVQHPPQPAYRDTPPVDDPDTDVYSVRLSGRRHPEQDRDYLPYAPPSRGPSAAASRLVAWFLTAGTNTRATAESAVSVFHLLAAEVPVSEIMKREEWSTLEGLIMAGVDIEDFSGYTLSDLLKFPDSRSIVLLYEMHMNMDFLLGHTKNFPLDDLISQLDLGPYEMIHHLGFRVYMCTSEGRGHGVHLSTLEYAQFNMWDLLSSELIKYYDVWFDLGVSDEYVREHFGANKLHMSLLRCARRLFTGMTLIEKDVIRILRKTPPISRAALYMTDEMIQRLEEADKQYCEARVLAKQEKRRKQKARERAKAAYTIRGGRTTTYSVVHPRPRTTGRRRQPPAASVPRRQSGPRTHRPVLRSQKRSVD